MQPITPDMLISDVLVTHPHAAEVFSRFGLGCPGCFAANMESISAVAAMHDVSVGRLLEELNADAKASVEERS